jgi:hypothetical protein
MILDSFPAVDCLLLVRRMASSISPCGAPVRAHAVCVQLQRGFHIRMPEQSLHRFRIGLRAHQERRKAMSQVVEPEAHLVPWLEHPGPDCCGSEMVFDQHVGRPWLPAFQLEGSEHPVPCFRVRGCVLPLLHELSQQRMKRHRRVGSPALRYPDSATGPSTTHASPVIRPITAPTLLKKQGAGATDYQRRAHLLTRAFDEVLDQNRKAG